MKKRVVIFGTRDFAQLAHYYLRNDSEFEVCGFSVGKAYMPEANSFCDLPVVAFEDVESRFPTSEFAFFAPMSSSKMNLSRAEVYNSIKKKGYNLISYVSSRATRFNNKIGDNCFILEDNTLQPFTDIGNNVVLWSGNHIGHHGRIHDHVFFTSHVVLSGHCEVGAYSFLGVNSTIRDGVKLAEGTLVAMGSMIMDDTMPWGVYKGSPAKIGPKKSNEIDF
jgi:sugar O-acyltransferase (sialic acid O-acetyltransferase NeuD family)